MDDDLDEALNVHEGERLVHLGAPVVATPEEYPVMPGDSDVLLGSVAAVEHDHLQASPVPVDHEHADQGIYLR